MAISYLPIDVIRLILFSYFVTEDGLIRKIREPEEKFQYYLSNNDRVNEKHREAFQCKSCHDVHFNWQYEEY